LSVEIHYYGELHGTESIEERLSMRFSLKNVMLFILLVAGVIGAHQWYWGHTGTNYELFFGLYCIIVAATTAGAIFQRNRPIARQVCLSVAIFGWTYQVIVLKGPDSVVQLSDGDSFSRLCLLGIALLAISGLASYLWVSSFNPKQSRAGSSSGEGGVDATRG
jgi:hypothetical protein